MRRTDAFYRPGQDAFRKIKKITESKHRTQAIRCLARRRADVLFAMLRDGTLYEPPTPITA